jgi:hypothetical protein
MIVKADDAKVQSPGIALIFIDDIFARIADDDPVSGF